MATFTGSTFGKYTKKWLIATGVFEMLLTAGFVVGAVLEPDVRSGFIVTAAILGVVGAGLVVGGLKAGASAARADRIVGSGLAGTGTITGLTQTGAFLNGNPRVKIDLAVSVPGRPAYQASYTAFVPLVMMGQLQNGASIPVKVDPQDPSSVIVDWAGGPAATPAGVAEAVRAALVQAGQTQAQAAQVAQAVQAAQAAQAPAVQGQTPGAGAETLDQVQAAAQASGLDGIGTPAPGMGGVSIAQLREFVRRTGVAGTGTLDRIDDTGREVGDDHILNVTMTVRVPGKMPHTSTSPMLVPKAMIGKVFPGTTVPVIVARDNPDVVVTEWERL